LKKNSVLGIKNHRSGAVGGRAPVVLIYWIKMGHVQL